MPLTYITLLFFLSFLTHIYILIPGSLSLISHPWTHKLLALANCRSSHPGTLPEELSTVYTTLLWPVWELALRAHPDKIFASYIVEGICEGFRIGFQHDQRTLRPKQRNLLSAYEHPYVVSEYLAEELKHNRILGPLSGTQIASIHVSSFGVIPKRHQPNKWHLIVDLSSPEGQSINDGIDSDTCSLSYISIDDIAATVRNLGHSALLAKTDIKHAYRQIPVQPHDRYLLGMRWQGNCFVDSTLLFGLRSAPLIFSAVADALEWLVKSRGVEHIFHYIDDFVVVGPSLSNACKHSLRTLTQTCENLGLLVAHEKTEGPSTRLTVLGIEFDTELMELRLPAEKLERLASLLAIWRGRGSGPRRDLESLAGILQHACSPGRIFMRRIYDTLARTHNYKPHYFVHLNAECRADIEWWCTFLRDWNGASIMRPLHASNPDVELYSDASGGWGCGAHWQSLWFQVPWGTLPIATQGIACKELFPITVAAIVWGHAILFDADAIIWQWWK